MKQVVVVVPLMLVSMLVIGAVVSVVALLSATVDLLTAAAADLRWAWRPRGYTGRPAVRVSTLVAALAVD